ncbi:MAG TPA: PEP-CTERM sorting domain-containing protein, partial [Lacipirellulaceae bacterium]
IPGGDLISGVGIVKRLNNPSGDFSSINYADYKITCGEVPEPTSILLMVCCGLGLFWFRRSRR